MRIIWLILITFITTNNSAYAVTPISPSESIAPIVLNEAMLDSVTAGAISSTAITNAAATGLTYAKTNTEVMTYAKAKFGNLVTGGKGVATARGDMLAVTQGLSISNTDTVAVSVQGTAIAIDEDAYAYTSVFTKAISTRYVDIAIGRVRSVACCGADSYTNVQASTMTNQDSSISHIQTNQINTPQLSISSGIAIILSINNR